MWFAEFTLAMANSSDKHILLHFLIFWLSLLMHLTHNSQAFQSESKIGSLLQYSCY